MREVVLEAPSDGRRTSKGADPNFRALTLAEKLYREHVLDYDEWQAASELRQLHFLLMPPSEGVSSYGGATGRADPTRKGDRKARRLTGIEIAEDGGVGRGPSRSNRSDQWAYRDALFALAGVHTNEGEKVIDPTAVRILIRAIIDSERMPTQTEIGRARATYIKDDGNKPSKQVTAIGAFFVKDRLARLAMHFRMVKGEAVR